MLLVRLLRNANASVAPPLEFQRDISTANTSKPAAAHKVYPYLLGGLSIERANQVWCSDITPLSRGQALYPDG